MKFKPWYRFEPFDLHGGTTPVELESLYDRPVGQVGVLVLLAGSEARARGWAARAAVRIAERLAARGHDVRLLDASVADPMLHRGLGASNDEGVSDLVLFGASIDRLEQPVAHGSVRLVPAGPPVPDAATVIGAARWDALLQSFGKDPRAHLVFVPAEVEGATSLAARAGSAIVLAAGSEAHAIASAVPRDCTLTAALHPAGDVVTTPAVADLSLPDWDHVRGPTTSAARWVGAGRGAPAHVEVPVATPDAPVEAPITEPYVVRETPRRHGVRPLRLILFLFLLFLLGWLVWDRFGDEIRGGAAGPTTGSPELATAPEPTPRQDAPPASLAGEPVFVPLDYAVAIEAYTDLDVALQRVAVLRQEEPDIGFLSSPTLVRGVIYHRVMAGPVSDRVAGTALMERLVAEGHKSSADDWAVRAAPWAYLVGEFGDSAQAEDRAASLWSAGVPAYVVAQPYTGGGAAYRVYYGAFESEEEAEALGAVIAEHGIEARLVHRSGGPDA
ncbi:MAG: SPOR domain-containing protein [Longimicrobiales bacterium]